MAVAVCWYVSADPLSTSHARVAALITATSVLGTYYTKTGVFAPSDRSSASSDKQNDTTKGDTPRVPGKTNGVAAECTAPTRGSYVDEKTKKCQACPAIEKTFAIFWPSEIDGCMDVCIYIYIYIYI